MNVPALLQIGIDNVRKSFPEFSEYSLTYSEAKTRWILHFSLSFPVKENRFVSNETNWYALVSPLYPEGSIEIFPDHENGISVTFQHQSLNTVSKHNPWRTGNVCVKTPTGSWKRKGFDSEPASAEGRLEWNIDRLLAWIYAASEGTLVEHGDPFELPQIPVSSGTTIIFNETSLSFTTWKQMPVAEGIVLAKVLRSNINTWIIHSFIGSKDHSINYNWGKFLSSSKQEIYGIWIKLKYIPVLQPWQIPLSWKELFKIGNNQGINICEKLEKLLTKYNNKYNIKFICIGFPIPTIIGEKASQLYWFSALLNNTPEVINGFRTGSEAYWRQIAKRQLTSFNEIKWLSVENWAKEQVTSRGSLHTNITDKKILIIGVGSVGSLVSELLVRLGVDTLTVIDKDHITIGNLSRHLLTIYDIGNSKSEAVVNRLNSIFPNVICEFISSTLEEKLKTSPDFLNGFDLIIDSSASDTVLFELQNTGIDKAFISISLGMNANRLYFYSSNTLSNIKMDFDYRMAEWLKKELVEKNNNAFLMERIGCWHPLFPARYDSIMMLVSASISIMEKQLDSGLTSQALVVIEKRRDKRFDSIQIVYENDCE